MPNLRTSRRIGAWWVLGLVPVLLLACEIGDAVKDVTGPHPILNFPTALGDPSVFPTGSVATAVGIGGFDTDVADGFDRATGALGNYVPIATTFGTASGFDVRSGFRNSSQDPRKPFLEASTASAGAFFGLFNPLFTNVGEGWWDLFGEVVGLKPTTTYTVALARMALVVNGELDQHEVLLGRAVGDPDSLYLLGGAEAGSSTIVCNFSAGVGVDASRNPVSLGTITTDASGNATVDCLPVAINDSPWWRSMASQTPPGAADSVPVGVNAAGSLLAGQYNYILLIEGQGVSGDPVPNVSPTIRIQMGPDLDASGNAINNAFAPFPAGVTDPNTVTSLTGGADAFATPGALSLSFTNLPPLTGATYKAFLLRASDGAAVDGTGEHAVDGGTATLEAAFNSPSDDAVHTIDIDNVTAGVLPGDYNRLVISIETTAGAATPANPFFIFDYLDDRGTTDPQDDLITQTGALALTRETAAGTKETFGLTGTGLAQIIHEDSLIVSLRRLAQPVPGWAYKAFLIEETGAGVLQEAFTGVVDVDLDGNADFRIDATPLGGLESYNKFVLTLQPSIGDPGTLMKYRVHASDDYRSKFADFFSP